MIGKKGRIAVGRQRLHLFRKLSTMYFGGYYTNLLSSRLCADIIRSYSQLEEETHHRNIVAWRPVVVDVMEGYTNFPRESFEKHIETFYPLIVDLLSRDLNSEIRVAVQVLLRRVGEVKLGLPAVQSPVETPTSPRSSFSQHFTRPRKHSKGH